jgi:hypothetical protein
MWVLRYRDGVPLKDRIHSRTLGSFHDLGDAQDRLESFPESVQETMEVVER